MSKDFIAILSLILLTAALWAGIELAQSKGGPDTLLNDTVIYEPLNPELDVGFLNSLE